MSPSATFCFLIDTDFQATLAQFSDLAPGDVILTNDPYASGGVSTHLPDLHLFQPYFHEGAIIAWGWSFDATASIPTITNSGTTDNPVAAAELLISSQVRTVLSHLDNSESYYVRGDGKFVDLQN